MTITITDHRNTLKVGGSSVAYAEYSFTTDALGDASEQTDATIVGQIQKVVTIPDAVDTPTAGWDLTVLDENGVDVLGGTGGDRDVDGTIATEVIQPYAESHFNSKLTFVVANGGATKKGVVRVYYT
jgi:hypothetical protein